MVNNIDNRLLTSPFEYAPAFDVALKRVVGTLGRSAKETADDVVRKSPLQLYYVRAFLMMHRTITVPMSELLGSSPVTLEPLDLCT